MTIEPEKPERDGWYVLGFPRWHIYPPEGNSRNLGPTRRRPKRFVDGEVYSKKAISGWCWTDKSAIRRAWNELDDDARFRCDQGAGVARFTLLVEHDPQVPAGGAAALMQELTARGMSYREVAKAAGISPDTASRLGTGVGRVRVSTEIALAELVGRNGSGRATRKR